MSQPIYNNARYFLRKNKTNYRMLKRMLRLRLAITCRPARVGLYLRNDEITCDGNNADAIRKRGFLINTMLTYIYLHAMLILQLILIHFRKDNML